MHTTRLLHIMHISRDANGSDRILHLPYPLPCVFVRFGAERIIDRIWIRKRIYLIADSERKWSGIKAETKLIRSIRLKVVNNYTTKHTKNKNSNMIK
jgi:hypothetical protein